MSNSVLPINSERASDVEARASDVDPLIIESALKKSNLRLTVAEIEARSLAGDFRTTKARGIISYNMARFADNLEMLLDGHMQDFGEADTPKERRQASGAALGCMEMACNMAAIDLKLAEIGGHSRSKMGENPRVPDADSPMACMQANVNVNVRTDRETSVTVTADDQKGQ
jgi:hypothetical protein